ncbi:MAG: hypothetical protein GF401_04405 [Chitinivibrionales bacterium]|nr:hypothetical protein [Chitinivibrionales bacterium]
MKKIFDAMLNNGLAIMMVGFFVSIAGLIAFVTRFRYYGGTVRTISISVTIAGFVIYFIGRICVVINKRRKKKTEKEASEEENEESE